MPIEPEEIVEGDYKPVEDGVGDEDQHVEPEAPSLDLGGLFGRVKTAFLKRLGDLTNDASADEPIEEYESEDVPAQKNLGNVNPDDIRRRIGGYFRHFGK